MVLDIAKLATSRLDAADADRIIAAAFRQHTSRALDPQLHTHVVIANRVASPDGRWLALDARLLKLDRFIDTFERHPTPRERWRLEREAILESQPRKPQPTTRLHDAWTDQIRNLGHEPAEIIDRALHRIEPRRLGASTLRAMVGQPSPTDPTRTRPTQRPSPYVSTGSRPQPGLQLHQPNMPRR